RRQREHGADLAPVDTFRPERDGLEVSRRLRAEAPQSKILAMSGGGRTGQIEILKAATALGAPRALRKPFEPHDLLAAIRDVLARSFPLDSAPTVSYRAPLDAAKAPPRAPKSPY